MRAPQQHRTRVLVRIPTQSQLKAMSNEELWAGLNQALQLTEDSLRLAAAFWIELQNRGTTIEADVPWSAYLPAVAAGRLDPKLILVYGWNDGLLAAVAALVPEDQAKIVNPRHKLPILVPKADGTAYETVMRAPSAMKVSELRQVFGDGRIRTPDEQRKLVPPLTTPPAPPVDRETADTRADFDLYNALTPAQREQVLRYAATRRRPVRFVDLVVRWAVQRGACKETPVPSRSRRSEARPSAELRV